MVRLQAVEIRPPSDDLYAKRSTAAPVRPDAIGHGADAYRIGGFEWASTETERAGH